MKTALFYKISQHGDYAAPLLHGSHCLVAGCLFNLLRRAPPHSVENASPTLQTSSLFSNTHRSQKLSLPFSLFYSFSAAAADFPSKRKNRTIFKYIIKTTT